ncbi:hypothetical protein BDN67DRAFT_1016021 [Paxillus ammoniavirescens]|nr:hypothetical protein BDN67DRAFT_1016021 [Paxillus ammoniavirescens]
MSSSDKIDPAELQCEEEQHHQEAKNRIWEAEVKKAEDEEKKRWAAEEARRRAKEEAEEEARKRAEEEKKKSQSVEADKKKKMLGVSVIFPQENKAGTSQAGSRSMAWWPGPKSPCANCTQLEIKCDPPSSKKSRTCFQCRISHIMCWEPGMQPKKKRTTIDLTSPQGGKEWKYQRQGSHDYQEKGSEDGIRGDKGADEVGEKREDALGALVEAIMVFTDQYEVEVAVASGFRHEIIHELGGIRIATQALVRAYLQDRAVRQGGLGLGLGARGSDKVGEGLGLKKVNPKGTGKAKSNPKGKGKANADLKGKGKGRVVDEDEDMDILDDKGKDRDEEDKDADGDIEIV